jgi:hypothetical protein
VNFASLMVRQISSDFACERMVFLGQLGHRSRNNSTTDQGSRAQKANRNAAVFQPFGLSDAEFSRPRQTSRGDTRSGRAEFARRYGTTHENFSVDKPCPLQQEKGGKE